MPQPKGHNGPSPEKLRDEVVLTIVADDVGDLEDVQGALAQIARLCVREYRRIGAVRERHDALPDRLEEARALDAARAAWDGRERRRAPDVGTTARGLAALVDAA